MHRLTSKEVDWSWEEVKQKSFELLQQKLMTAPVLGYPDHGQTYILDTDASGFGVEAVLSQEQKVVTAATSM